MFVAEVFTGQPGKYVKIEDTVKGFKEILEGKHDKLPEQAFYMTGTIEEAVKNASVRSRVRKLLREKEIMNMNQVFITKEEIGSHLSK